MLADPPNVDGSKSENRSLPEGLPIRRMGLEQEFFLVDRSGVLRDLADRFLRRCREAAQAAGLDARCFKAECAKGLLEIATQPSYGVEELAKEYLNNLHLELPAGTVWPDVKVALDAPLAVQRELLGLYNLATALDPALVALTRACPFYEGRADGFATRTVHYRGILGFEGLYADLREVGGLSPYASRVEDLVDQQRARYRAWFAAMDLAGVGRRLFAQAGGNLHRASWNPVRLSHHGTVEIRSMDANYPEMVMAVCALIRGAAERVRHEQLEVRPSRGVLTLEPDGDLLHVPIFSYLNGELLGAAVTRGVLDQRVEAYVDSFIRFASPYLQKPELVEPLGSSGSYRTTESEVLGSLPTPQASLSRGQGLSLVRESCRRLNEQVSTLRRRYEGAPPREERDPGVARVINIRDSPTTFAEKAHPASVDDAQATARAANNGPA